MQSIYAGTRSMTTPSLYDRILLAHAAIRPQVAVTPLERSNALSAAIGCDVMLKAEHLQPTGVVQDPGRDNKIRVSRGRCTGYRCDYRLAGNHGQAVARAGRQ